MFVANVERTFAIDRPTMWRLWTEPDHLARWFRPSPDGFGPSVAKVDLRPGGLYRIEMVPMDGDVHAISGQFVDVDEPSLLSFTWTWDGQDHESFVEVVFSAEADGRTSVAVTHTKLQSQEDADQHREGWVGCLEVLARTS